MRSNRQGKRARAFTLIELLVVIMILAVLAAMIVPRLIGRGGQAKQAAARSDLATLRNLLEAFHIDNGRYPTTEEGLDGLRVQPADLDNWKGPYATKDIPNDPWKNAYNYEHPGSTGDDSYLLYSYGRDNTEGGEGEDEDIIESGE